jgi:hypothetical protein
VYKPTVTSDILTVDYVPDEWAPAESNVTRVAVVVAVTGMTVLSVAVASVARLFR